MGDGVGLGSWVVKMINYNALNCETEMIDLRESQTSRQFMELQISSPMALKYSKQCVSLCYTDAHDTHLSVT